MTFKQIYDAVKPDEPMESYSRSHKLYAIAASNRKDACVDSILEAMELDPMHWTTVEKFQIARKLWGNPIKK